MFVRLQRPFSVITPTVDGAVLTVLAGADAAFTVPQIHRIAGEYSVAGVRKAVHRLVEEGIVTDQSVGRTHLYRLNRAHIAAEPILVIARSRDTLTAKIRERLERFSHRPAFAALFGSAALGKMRTGSDIDMLLVRPGRLDAAEPQWVQDVADLSSDVTAWTGNDTRVLEIAEGELTRADVRVEPVLSTIQHDGVVLVGDPDYLRSKGVR